MCSPLRLLSEEWPADLLPAGAAPPGAGRVRLPLLFQTRLFKAVLQEPAVGSPQVKRH